ncbi:MAG: cob(I)yrinic acid a,c-diamide adenosyltransferase [Candidatus Hodarchaeales archaeon]
MTFKKDQIDSESLGLIHVISGDGKGKTTSALGIALRAAGHEYNVLIIQFMKKGWDYGELQAVQFLNGVEIHPFGTPNYIDKANPQPIDFSEARKALKHFKDELNNPHWNIIVLDEINVALDFKLISERDIIDLLRTKPKNLEIILTGRDAPSSLIELADYYTEIKSIKHPFQKKILARKGVEY